MTTYIRYANPRQTMVITSKPIDRTVMKVKRRQPSA
jgi:hypothetical protein